MRRILAAAIALWLLTACGATPSGTQAQGTPETRSFGDPSSLEDDPTPAPEATAAPRAGTTTQRPGTRATTKPGTNAVPAPARTLPPARPNDNGGTGSNAKLYLQPNVPKLVIEMGAVAGEEPTQGSLDFAKQQLGPILDKPGGIEFRLTATFPSLGKDYTFADLRALEEQHRETHSDREQASMYILWMDRRHDANESNGIGIAYGASNIVMYTDYIEDIALTSGSIGGRTGLERAVLMQEIGHLLALVNIGYRSPRDHHDEAHPHHSKNKQSVMYYAVTLPDVATVFRGGPPDKFDADDLADLRDLRANLL